MLNSRDQTVLLFSICFLLCLAAAVVTFVATAQTAAEDVKAVERSKNFEPTAIEKTGDPKSIEAPDAAGAAPTIEGPVDSGVAGHQETRGTVSIVGRALDAKDKGRRNAVITLYEADGTQHHATTDGAGNFRFERISEGQQIVLSVGNEPDEGRDLSLQLAGETRVFWRTPEPQIKSGKR